MPRHEFGDMATQVSTSGTKRIRIRLHGWGQGHRIQNSFEFEFAGVRGLYMGYTRGSVSSFKKAIRGLPFAPNHDPPPRILNSEFGDMATLAGVSNGPGGAKFGNSHTLAQ